MRAPERTVATILAWLALVDAGMGNGAPRAPAAEWMHPLPGLGKGAYTDGRIGRAAVASHALQYDRRACMHAAAGTVEMWVRPDVPVASIQKGGYLFTIGDRQPFWLYTVLQDGEARFVWFNGRFPFRNADEFHGSIKAEGLRWPAGEWHHLAFVWAVLEPGESVMQIYLDGALKAERYTVTLQPIMAGDRLRFGGNSDRPGPPGFPGAIDEVRISNYPKTPEDIRAGYLRGVGGLPLALEPSTLLLLDFDGTTMGRRATTAILSHRRIREAVEQIFDSLERGP